MYYTLLSVSCSTCIRTRSGGRKRSNSVVHLQHQRDSIFKGLRLSSGPVGLLSRNGDSVGGLLVLESCSLLREWSPPREGEGRSLSISWTKEDLPLISNSLPLPLSLKTRLRLRRRPTRTPLLCYLIQAMLLRQRLFFLHLAFSLSTSTCSYAVCWTIPDGRDSVRPHMGRRCVYNSFDI